MRKMPEWQTRLFSLERLCLATHHPASPDCRRNDRIPDLAAPITTSRVKGLKIVLNRRILFWGCLLSLVIGTVASWQFRFKETGSIYWRDQSLEPWTQIDTPQKASLPTWQMDGQLLEFSDQDKTRSISNKSWAANGAKFVKVRLTHRTTDDFHFKESTPGYPILVHITPFDAAHHPLLEGVSVISSVPPNQTWRTREAVAPLPDHVEHFSLFITTNADSGSYQIESLDVVSADLRAWVPFATPLLFIVWTGWILWAIRRRRGEGSGINPSSIFCAIWIILWGSLLVFPRFLDIPRPFFETFNSSSGESSQHRIESENFELPPPPQPSSIQNSDESKRTAEWRNALYWLKKKAGGRFLLHLGVMGLFAGVLLLLMPFQQAYPFILAMAIGVELVPWFWLRDIDRNDAWDVVSYAVAIAIVTPVTSRFRRK